MRYIENKKMTKKRVQRSGKRTNKNITRNTTSTTSKQICENVGFENSFVDSSVEDVEKKLIKMFKTPFAPSKVRLEDDYYTYINYKWMSEKTKELKTTKKYYTQVDSFRIEQEKVYYKINEIILNLIKHNADNKKGQTLKNLYYSFLELDSEETTKKYLLTAIEYIDKLLNQDDIHRFLADVNSNEMISWAFPVYWNILLDEKNSKYYISHLSVPELSIYDYDVYITNKNDTKEKIKEKNNFKSKFFSFINEMFISVFGENNDLNIVDVWDVELDILDALYCYDKTEDENGYNVVKSENSIKELNFDWNKFMTYLGYSSEQIPKCFIVQNKSYIRCIMKKLLENNNWKSKKWRTYYIYIITRQAIRFNRNWRMIYYKFYGEFIEGNVIAWPKEVIAVFGTSICFNTLITKEYIKVRYEHKNICYVQALFNDLIHIFKRIIKRNDWLSPKTKKYALLKLEHIKLILGKPDNMRDDPLLDYKKDEAFGNLRKIALWRHKQLKYLEGKRVDIDIPYIDWKNLKFIGKQSYVVNAYYTPTENSIYIPWAYLGKPFVDLEERGIEYNLAHIGYTLCHEMSHSLDDLGSLYDYKGNLYNWWTKNDREVFDKKVRNVIQQYELFAHYDGIEFDASISTGEDLADISGLKICVEYLRDFQEKNKDAVPIRALSFHAFFTYIAIQARQKIYDKAIRSQLKINPHPLDKYRANCALARLKLFQKLYNIKPTDKMYWHNTDTIW